MEKLRCPGEMVQRWEDPGKGKSKPDEVAKGSETKTNLIGGGQANQRRGVDNGR